MYYAVLIIFTAPELIKLICAVLCVSQMMDITRGTGQREILHLYLQFLYQIMLLLF